MKRINAILAIILLTLMPQLVVLANSSSDVWSDISIESDSATVSLFTNAELGDGYFEVQYDDAILECEESGVNFQADIDMHSVNIKDGTVKVAVLSDVKSKDEAFASIKFTPAKGVDKLSTDSVKVTFYGEANDLNGNFLKVESTAPKNGDNQMEHGIFWNTAIIYAIVAVIACVLVIFFVRKAKRK